MFSLVLLAATIIDCSAEVEVDNYMQLTINQRVQIIRYIDNIEDKCNKDTKCLLRNLNVELKLK